MFVLIVLKKSKLWKKKLHLKYQKIKLLEVLKMNYNFIKKDSSL